jgi:hypothetical protein
MIIYPIAMGLYNTVCVMTEHMVHLMAARKQRERQEGDRVSISPVKAHP